MIEFRWLAAIALWTLLIGPIVGVPAGSDSPPPAKLKVVSRR